VGQRAGAGRHRRTVSCGRGPGVAVLAAVPFGR